MTQTLAHQGTQRIPIASGGFEGTHSGRPPTATPLRAGGFGPYSIPAGVAMLIEGAGGPLQDHGDWTMEQNIRLGRIAGVPCWHQLEHPCHFLAHRLGARRSPPAGLQPPRNHRHLLGRWDLRYRAVLRLLVPPRGVPRHRGQEKRGRGPSYHPVVVRRGIRAGE